MYVCMYVYVCVVGAVIVVATTKSRTPTSDQNNMSWLDTFSVGTNVTHTLIAMIDPKICIFEC